MGEGKQTCETVPKSDYDLCDAENSNLPCDYCDTIKDNGTAAERANNLRTFLSDWSRKPAKFIDPAPRRNDDGCLFLAEAGARHNVHPVPVWPLGARTRSLPVFPYLMLAG